MKLIYPYIQPNDTPVANFDEILVLLQQKQGNELRRRIPWALVSRCPFCNTAIWMQVGIYSLRDNFWFRAYGSGRDEVWEGSICEHLFCVDGALNFNGKEPTDAKYWFDYRSEQMEGWQYIWMAAEAPFVLPRVLALPTMKAVIHDIPICDGKYTAFPIAYFAAQKPAPIDFCIPWGRKMYLDTSGGYSSCGERSDAQDFELEKWVKRGSLFWLDKTNQDYSIANSHILSFPYRDVSGRKHPYTIKDGKIQDLPERLKDGKPIKWAAE